MPMACLAAGPDTTVHVTYTTRAARADQVVRDLAGLSKLDLEVSPQTKNEVLVISVKDVPLSDLMARIAEVTSGEWKQEGNIYRLVGSATLRSREERTETADRTSDIRRAIAARESNEKKRAAQIAKAIADAEAKAKTKVKTDAKAKTNTDDQTNDNGMDDMISADASRPDESTITELLKGVDASVLGEIEIGDRVVFSTDPTRTQRSLGSNATEVINEFIQKHDATAVNAQPDLGEEFNGMTADQIEAMRQIMKQQHTGKIGQAAKALLVAEHSPMVGMMGANGLEIEFKLYDAKGKILYATQTTLGDPGQMDTLPRAGVSIEADTADGPVAPPGLPQQPPAQAAPKPKTTPIEYSPESQELMKASTGLNGGSFTLKLSHDLRQKLLLPTMYDPLSFLETDAVLFYAKSIGKPLVADLPDSFSEGSTPFGGEGSKTLEAFTKNLQDHKQLSLVTDDAYTVIKPARPAQSREDRLDRSALATLLQATQEKGIPALDDLAAFATAAPDPMKGGVSMTYLVLFVPGGMPVGLDGMVSWDMLRFYGELSPDSRTQLANGGKLQMGSLTVAQRALAERLTYGAGANLSVAEPGQKPQEDMPFFMDFMGGSKADDYRGEPTEVAPGGLPPSGYIDCAASTEPFAAPVPGPNSETMAFLGVLSPDELGLFKMMKTEPGMEQAGAQMPKFPQLRVGQSSVLKFAFHLTPEVSIKQTLRDRRIDKNSSIYSEDNLPADFQKRIADRADALKKSPFGALGSFMGGQAVHP